MRCSMPRRARIAPGEIIYHALNRANGRSQLFDKPEDYAAFERIMVAAMRRSPIRLLAYCLMPNHWHMVLWPKKDGEMTSFFAAYPHSQPAPTRPPPHQGLRAYLPRAVQKFSRRAGSSRAQCDPLRGTQRLASPPRRQSAELALVLSVAKSSWVPRIAAERLALR